MVYIRDYNLTMANLMIHTGILMRLSNKHTFIYTLTITIEIRLYKEDVERLILVLFIKRKTLQNIMDQSVINRRIGY